MAINDESFSAGKRNLKQEKISKYFSNMKKVKTTSSAIAMSEEDEELTVKRELMASAAESRIDKESSTSEDFSSSQIEKKALKSLSLGTPLNQFNRLTNCICTLPIPDSRHTFLVDFKKLSDSQNKLILPYPVNYKDKWCSDFVRMPCSPDNLYPIGDSLGVKKVESRWDLIVTTLQKPILSSQDLERAIITYNARYVDKWNFRGLHSFFTHSMDSKECQLIFTQIIPFMIKLIVNLPLICTQPPPLLSRGQNRSVTLSQKQIACLLANAFFCTFPRRNAQRKQSEYANYPDINFIHLFSSSKPKIPNRQAEKFKCIFHYFLRLSKKDPGGCVTFQRQCIKDFPSWESSTRKLRNLHVSSRGTIEDDGYGMLQVDFANRFVGGGVLGRGCVQEEIRFVICPELILSRLFTECLQDNECLIVTGIERFSEYSGYSDDFMWKGDCVDKTPRDSLLRRMTQVVAIDAMHFHGSHDQFQEKNLRREINKAYCGFYVPESQLSQIPAIATGNWGCGVYQGDPCLKLLLQLMAATEAGRDLVYFTFNNSNLCSQLHSMYTFLVEKDLSVGDVWRILLLFQEVVKCKTSKKKVFDFIYEVVDPSHVTS